jgi:uncharacterized lipoprotein YmbA
MIRLRRPVALVLAVAGAWLGCASAPPERFYTLSAAVTAPAADRPGRSVVVGPAALPDVVDRPQLVMSTGANRVSILEQQRWAEPLRVGIPRVVAENLGQLLASSRVSTREEAIATPDCRVSLDVRRFDASPGGRVSVEALWTVACGAAPRRTGTSRAEQPISGKEYEAVVAAYGRALTSVSRDIAGAIGQVPPG